MNRTGRLITMVDVAIMAAICVVLDIQMWPNGGAVTEKAV
jgi:thiamine transporter ThiT